MRILFGESDQDRAKAMHGALRRLGYATDFVRSGRELLGALSTHMYDGVIASVPMADMPAEALLKSVRREQAGLPLILLLGAESTKVLVTLLDQGADDCLMHPFHFDELAARIRALMRRPRFIAVSNDAITHGALQLQPQRRRATLAGREVKLTQCEFAVLEALMHKRHRVCSRALLEESLYAWRDEVSSNAVEVYVHHLRRKLFPDVIRTVRGIGYQLGAVPR